MEKIEMSEKDEQKLEEEIKKKIKQAPTANERVRLHLINNNLLKKKQLDKQLEEEIQKVTKQMEMKAEPLQKEINDIVQGSKEITSEDVKDIMYLSEEEKKEVQTIGQKMSGYWFKVMKNCDEIARDIKKKDEDALKSLIKIEKKQEENGKDFSITFFFLENEYFESPCELTKKFKMKNEQEAESTTCEEIKWKEGKNLTTKITEKKQKNKKTGKTRIIKKTVSDESFFNFFKDTEARDESDDEEDEENEFISIEDQLDMAQFFLDELIPYSLEYYFALRKGEDDGLEDVDEEDEDDEDDDDDEEDEVQHKKNKKEKKKPRKRSGVSDKSDKEKKDTQQQSQEKPECKQQ